MSKDVSTEDGLIEMTRLVKEFAFGVLGARDFIEKYSNFYYYEAFDGHEASSAKEAGRLTGLGNAVELHRRIQKEVVNRLGLDAQFPTDVLEVAGRLTVSQGRELALRICADVGIEAVLSTIRPA